MPEVKSRLAVVFCVFVLAELLSGFAQRLETDANGNKRWVRDGADIPLYMVVDSFFNRLDLCRNAQDNRAAWRGALEGLLIPQASDAEALLLQKLDQAKEIRTRSVDLAPYLGDREAFIGVQLDLLEGQVQDLETVYRDLLSGLNGDSRKAIENALELVVRPSMTVFSFPDPDTKAFEIMASFMARPTAGDRTPSRPGTPF